MNFMEILDPITGKKKRRKLSNGVPTQGDIQKNIQQIAPNPSRTQTLAYDARAHQMGKPRTQGFNGVNQGVNGFIGSLVKSTMPKIDSTLNDIKAQPQYKMPEFTTDNALSKEWFDTALKRIAVRNKMKMNMERVNALSKIFPSLVSGASTATNAAVEADRAKLINQSKQSELSEQKRWHDIMGEYYRGLLAQKEQGEPDPYKMDKIKIERYKLLSKSPATLIPQWDDLDETQKSIAAQYFVEYGKLPPIKKNPNSGWFSSEPEYIIDIGSDTAPQQPSPNQRPQDTHTTTPTIGGNKVLDERRTSDGKYYIKLEDGNWYEVD